MKKNSFMGGAIIATAGIIICKILGLLYVIPFYALVGSTGGTLYGYAYSIYGVFLNLSVVGIPIAVSKIVSEYTTLGYYHTKEKAYKIAMTMIKIMGFTSFICLFLFAPNIAGAILKDMTGGGNTVEDVTMVIRIVSTALLIVPSLSVTKGYLQGHKIITPSSVANILEQLIRVIMIVLGTYLAIKVFSLPVEKAVGIAVFAATVGALVAYIYLKLKIKKTDENFGIDKVEMKEEKEITTKDILKKIIFYAMPFIAIDLINSSYSLVDTFTVGSTMYNLGYSKVISESVYGVVSTWAPKIIMIIISIATGLCISLIPNITAAFVKNDTKELTNKINKSLQALLLVALPLTLGLLFLAKPVWIVFYGFDALSISIFRFFIIQALSYSFYIVIMNILQAMNNVKLTIGILLLGFFLKAGLNVPLMTILDKLYGKGYYGSSLATIIPQIICIIIVLIILNVKHKISYKPAVGNIFKILTANVVMVVSLYIVELIIPLTTTNRIAAIFEMIPYVAVGGIVYGLITWKTGLLTEMFGRFKKKKTSTQ